MTSEFKAAVTVAEMSRMVNLSRSRFYQLIGTAFPEPSRDANGRPYYDEDQQRLCLDVRKRNCGVDGKPILFYPPRNTTPRPDRSPRKASTRKAHDDRYSDILEGVKALGLTTATMEQVAATMEELFPEWEVGTDLGEVIRQVFLSVRRQNSADNLGR
jgi:hypothetical protein